MLIRAFAIGASLLANGAAAMEMERGFGCTFVTECIETEACAKTHYIVELSGDSSTLVTVHGDLHVYYHDRSEGANIYLARDASQTFVLTAYDMGDGRLSVQGANDPFVATYLGTCGEIE